MGAILFFYFLCSVTVMSNGGVLFKVFVSSVAAVPVTCRSTDHSMQPHFSYLTSAI